MKHGKSWSKEPQWKNDCGCFWECFYLGEPISTPQCKDTMRDYLGAPQSSFPIVATQKGKRKTPPSRTQSRTRLRFHNMLLLLPHHHVHSFIFPYEALTCHSIVLMANGRNTKVSSEVCNHGGVGFDHCWSSRGFSCSTSFKFAPLYSKVEQTQCARCGGHIWVWWCLPTWWCSFFVIFSWDHQSTN